MGTWSISPNTGLASIDRNGLATFEMHSEDTVYTISYLETPTSSAITKNVTVKACPPVKCGFSSNGLIPAEGGNSIVIGSYYNNCGSGQEEITPMKDYGDDFLSNFKFENGLIKADVTRNNTTSQKSVYFKFASWGGCCSQTIEFVQASGTPVTNYTFTVYSNVEGASVNIGGSSYTISGGKAVLTSTDPTSRNVSISKAGYTFSPSTGVVKANNSITLNGYVTPPPATCDTCAKIGVSQQQLTTTVPNTGGTATLGRYTTNCENSTLIVKRVSGSNFISNIGIVRNSSTSYTITGYCSSNIDSYGQRSEYIAVFLGSSQCGALVTINQNGKDSCTCSVTGKTNVTNASATSVLIATYTSSCSSNATVGYVDGAQIIQTPTCSISNGNIKATVNENTSTSSRTGYYSLYFDNIKCADFTVTQNGATPQACTCSSANFSVTGTTVDPGINVIAATYTANCIDGASVVRVEGDNILEGTISISNGMITASKVNTSTVDRTGSYAIEIDGSKCAYFTVNSKGFCSCEDANVQIGTTAITLGYAAGSTAETTYSHNCTVYVNNNEADGWLDVNTTDGKLEFNTTSQATSTRSANVYIDDANGNHCKTINVTQNGCGAKLNISYGIQFENQLVAVDSLLSTAVYSVGGAKVNYTKCDGSKGSFLISAAYGTTDTFVNFRKGDFIDGSEAKKTTSFTVSDLASIDSITLPQFISVGGGCNIWGTTETPWGGDFRNLSEKTPGTTYAYGCYASCITNDSLINARNTYTLNGNNLTIYLSFEEIVL